MRIRAVRPKGNKFSARKVTSGGITHDSLKEADRWRQLQRLEHVGQIRDLQRQVPFVLAPAVRLDGEPRKKPALRYVADFTYMLDGHLVVEDAKSPPTRKLPAYRIKKHLMATVHGVHIREV